MPPASSSSKYLAMVKGLYKSYAIANNFQRTAGKCRVVDTEEGRVKVEMDVEEEHTNPFGTLHGGLTATLVDIVTTTALMATRRGNPGLSVNLTVNYLAPARIGDTIVVDAHVTRAGKNMGFTAAEIYRKGEPNTKIATALHVKAFVPKGEVPKSPEAKI